MTSSPRGFPTGGERALFALSIAGALTWGIANWREGATGALLFAKGATVGLLVVVALGRRRTTPGGALFATALAAHAIGDLLIERTLLAAVASFFLGHLGYLTLFWRRRRPFDELRGSTKLALGLLALAAAAFVVRLAPALRSVERIAIPVYVIALLSMAGSALNVDRARRWVASGALLYVASDALLSLDLFGRGAGDARHLTWPLYAAAQLAIAWGWIGGGNGDDARMPAPTPPA